MENKTAEKILSNINNVEFDSNGDPLYSYDQLRDAMKLHTDQEVSKAIDKSLEVASEEAWLLYHDGHFKSNNHGQKQINIGADHVKIDKLSILSLKPEILKELNK